jgi:ubiquitin C-terminal hydrolase
LIEEIGPSAADELEKPITLAQCMKEFSKEEILSGNDSMYCSVCKTHQPTKKRLTVYTTPDVIQFNKDTGVSPQAVFKH